MPTVQLDTHIGTDVVVVKSGRRICGTGGCLANAPLHQNKSYFEFKIQSTGSWGIGVATQKANLNQIPMGRDIHTLVLRHDGSLFHNNEEKNCLPACQQPAAGGRYCVDDGAIIDCQFTDFYRTPPQGFEKILFEQQVF